MASRGTSCIGITTGTKTWWWTGTSKSPENGTGNSQLISVVVPAYNEAASLDELYRRIRSVFASEGDFEFIVVNDGSSDETSTVLRALSATHQNIVVLTHRRNHGKSLALMQGFDVAQGDILIMLDADLQDVPEMIPE